MRGRYTPRHAAGTAWTRRVKGVAARPMRLRRSGPLAASVAAAVVTIAAAPSQPPTGPQPDVVAGAPAATVAAAPAGTGPGVEGSPGPVTLPRFVDTPDAVSHHRVLAASGSARSAERSGNAAADAEAHRRARLGEVADGARARAAEREAAEREAEREAAEREAEREAAEREAQSLSAAQADTAPHAALPVTDYQLTGRFGQAGSRWASTHTGLDFAAPTGTTIRAVASGQVIAVESHPAYGNLTKLRHDSTTTSWYAHQSAVSVSPGQWVDTGQPIGAVGSTGNSTGPHVHLEIRVDGSPVDPYAWLADRQVRP